MSNTIFSSYNNIKNYNPTLPIIKHNGEYSKNSLDYIIKTLENDIQYFKNIRDKLENG